MKSEVKSDKLLSRHEDVIISYLIIKLHKSCFLVGSVSVFFFFFPHPPTSKFFWNPESGRGGFVLASLLSHQLFCKMISSVLEEMGMVITVAFIV